MASLLNKNPEAYQAEREQFLRGLRHFHDQKGTSFRHVPVIDGKELDLYQLYWAVTAQGGFETVNTRNGWDELSVLFDYPENTGNGALLLKQVYLRYLDSYEKAHYAGDELDNDDIYGDEEDSRLLRRAATGRSHGLARAACTVPLSYNHAQHSVPDECRAELNMATKVYRRTDYDRLALSLTSPLPNEQDFGINVCTLLSNEGRHTLKLAKCPRLLDLLLSHAGLYNHENMKAYIGAMYLDARKYDLLAFWKQVCEDRSVRDLMLKYYPGDKEGGDERREEEDPDEPGTSSGASHRLGQVRRKALEDLSSATVAKERLVLPASRERTTEEDLFSVGAHLGTRDLAGQRVLQIATIVRNLSFEEDNSTVLACNQSLLRFCLLCCSSRWSNLNQMGFDILSNVASEVVLQEGDESCITDVMLSTLANSMASKDRFQVISSLDVLNKLAQQESNENFLGTVLSDDTGSGRKSSVVYDQLAAYLTLHDIHLLISTLECLYSLSSLGESACSAIARTHGAVDSLVSLVTVEAQSYGPKACILMRVVETVPGAASVAAAAGVGGSIGQPARAVIQQQPRPQQQVALVGGQVVQVSKPQQQATAAATTATLTGVQPQGQAVTTPQPVVATGGQATRQVVVTTTSGGQVTQVVRLQSQQPVLAPRPAQAPLQQQPQQAAAAHQQQQQPQQQQQAQPQPQAPSQQVQLRVCNDEANRTFCLSWLRATYESAAGCSIQHEIMYKQYLASLHKLGKRDVISAQHYAACVRSLFGGGAGPNKRQMTNGKVDSFFEGVRVRAQPLPLRIQMTTTTTAPTPVTQPAVQQQQQQPQQPAAAAPSQNTVSSLVAAAAVNGPKPPAAVMQPQNVPVVSAAAVTPRQTPIIPSLRPSQLITTTPQNSTVKAAPATSTTASPPTSSAAQSTTTTQSGPQSPILTNLLHRSSPAPDAKDGSGKEDHISSSKKPEQNGGATILDGLLSDAPKAEEVTNKVVPAGGMLAHLLEKKGVEARDVPMVNGVDSAKDKKVPDFAKMNGGNGTTSLKRPASAEPEEAPAPKSALVEPVAVTNGVKAEEEEVKEEGEQQKPVILKQTTAAAGQLLAQAATPQVAQAVGGGGGASEGSGGVVAAGGTTPNTSVVILQPHSKVLTSQNAPSAASVVTNGQAASAAPATTNGQPKVNGEPPPKPQQAQGTPSGAPQQPSGNPSTPTTPATTAAGEGANSNQARQSPSQPSPVQLQSAATPSGGAAPAAPAGAQAAAAAAVVAAAATATSSAKAPSGTPGATVGASRPSPQAPFLCEWQGCGQAYRTPKEVENHAIKVHCPLGQDDIPCLWSRCDGMKRKRFSLMTHIQDRHCHPQLMKLMAVRRVQMATTGKSEVPLPPAPPPHPGYAPNAAYHAIKRHAAEFATPKAQAMGDEKEGPVTKSIRLTSALILKNLVIYSSLGRRRLQAYESHLSTVALSNVESSRTVSQILFDMSSAADGGSAPVASPSKPSSSTSSS